MRVIGICVQLLLLHVGIYLTDNINVVRPLCPQSAKECETRLILEKHSTVLDSEESPNGMTLEADGVAKPVLTYNGTLPGPPIVVYEGQQVVVRVTNLLASEGTTVHWHGIEQRHTPWMDGVDGVSQCAINPPDTFTYRFLAQPVGTHWYHSHHGAQRSMGAAGPLIVLPKSKESLQRLRGNDPLPEFTDDFYLMVTDWMRNDSVDVGLMVHYEMVSYPFGFGNNHCYDSTKQADGLDCGVFPFMSGLINGKGGHEADALEHFRVTSGGIYRFRVICSSMTFGFRMSIDSHALNVISTDGADVVATQVESFVIFSGERYDIWINATDPLKAGSYWIRAQTLERTQDGKPIQPGHVHAVLVYDDAKGTPQTSRQNCSQDTPCAILGCPFKSFPESEHKNCIPVSDLRSTQSLPTEAAGTSEFVEHFLNFHFVQRNVTYSKQWKPSVNGNENKLPSNPYQLASKEPKPCSAPCEDGLCLCPYVIDIPINAVVQLVLVSTIRNPPGVINGNPHQIHLHGHHFEVIKTGFPIYNETTKKFHANTPDVKCLDLQCNKVVWANPSWNDGNVPGITEKGAPLKDTITVPGGGYIVVRFKADNPGYWYMHCHTEFHNTEGMALVLKEGKKHNMPAPPRGIPRCADFVFPELVQPELANKTVSCVSTLEMVVMIVLPATLIFATCVLIYYCCDTRLKSKSSKLSNGQ